MNLQNLLSNSKPSSLIETSDSRPFSVQFTSDYEKEASYTRSNTYSIEGLQRPKPREYVFPYEPNDQVDTYLNELAEKYNIKKNWVERLHLLEQFEIIILCDDSGSMNSRIDGLEKTRWEELKEIVKIILEIATIFDENGVDVYFINRSSILNVTDPKVIDESFIKDPSGYGSLAPLLHHIFHQPESTPGNDKKLLVFVATDGSLIDETNQEVLLPLERVMKEERISETTHVMFLLCDKNPISAKYFAEWDRNMENVDVTGNYKTEKELIQQFQGFDYPFSFGDYVVKALLGAVDPEIDALNEPSDTDDDNHQY